ncbi:MAG: hydroxymethylglutaryl-CoA lyase [Bacteroidota bacterium]
MSLKIIESPRDGFQGIEMFIPTAVKTAYINELFKAGFETVEVGSFVSPKAIPQMKDTPEVLAKLDLSGTQSKVMTLIANMKGGLEAISYNSVDQLYFPFGISETFQKKNINSTFDKSKAFIRELNARAIEKKKELMVVLSMGFGNPYGDPWSVDLLLDFCAYFYDQGFRVLPIADGLGHAGPDLIHDVFSAVIPTFPDMDFGIHLHTTPDEYYEKVDAAYQAGVRRFDTVLGGIGGCPMTDRELVGNLNTLSLIEYCEKNNIEHGLDTELLRKLAGKYSF